MTVPIPPGGTGASSDDFRDIAEAVVFQQMLRHPLPWRVEHDWTYEVTAQSGHIIAKCMTEEAAERIIAFAQSIMSELVE